MTDNTQPHPRGLDDMPQWVLDWWAQHEPHSRGDGFTAESGPTGRIEAVHCTCGHRWLRP